MTHPAGGAGSGVAPVVVLGLGNVLLRDDGLGPAVVAALGEEPVPGTAVVDGGTGGLSLLPLIADARALVLVDAVDVGAAPGEVRVLSGNELFADLAHLSVHEVGAADLLAAARMAGSLPASVVLVGVQPRDLDAGLGLSDPVGAAVPAALEAVRSWCRRFATLTGAGGA